MKKLSVENFLENKYNRLLIALIFIIVSFPFLQAIDTRFPFISMVLLIAIIPALGVVLPLKPFLCMMSTGILAFIFEILIKYQFIPVSKKCLLIVLGLYALFLLLAVVILIKKISSMRIITSDTVKGGISIYFLIGLLWTIFYMIMLIINPQAFNNIQKPSDNFYYSFTTLTTLGYGDITPATTYAKLLSISEAFVGQVYLAIFIAQLVGLAIAQKLQQKQEE
ncbi:MAG: two pore domain potassium channel family protein [Deltaproteobacteria bacterium]|nr:two pore domain potassium channel family protein [Deltaproteobacteria bacterium]